MGRMEAPAGCILRRFPSVSDGAQCILSSCGEFGDFGSHCIKPALHQITTIALGALPVTTKESAFRSFRTQVLDGHEDRTDAFWMLEEHFRSMRMPRLEHADDTLEFRVPEPALRQIEKAVALREAFLCLLEEAETRSLRARRRAMAGRQLYPADRASRHKKGAGAGHGSPGAPSRWAGLLWTRETSSLRATSGQLSSAWGRSTSGSG